MKNIKIFIIYSFMLLTALALVSLSSMKADSKSSEEPRICDFGFTAAPMAGGMAFVSFAMEIENPNIDVSVCNVSVRLTWKDASGNLITVEDEILPVLFSGQVTGYAANTSFSATPHSVTAELLTGDAIDVPIGELALQNPLQLSPLRFVRTDRGPSLAGHIINPNATSLHQAVVTAVYKNDSGQITGGISSTVEKIAMKGTTPFTLECFPQTDGQKIPEDFLNPQGKMDLSLSCRFQDLPRTGHFSNRRD